MKVFFYPFSANRESSNPFGFNFVSSLAEQGVDVVNYKKQITRYSVFDMFLMKSDAYILNWIEDLPNRKFGNLLAIMFLSFFFIQRLRGKKFVWVFHNIESHYKENALSRRIKKSLINHAYFFITLSGKGRAILSQKTKKNIIFLNHPINSDLLSIEAKPSKKSYDVLIWGSIIRYKGILEFLQYLHDKGMSERFRVLVVGGCKDVSYFEELSKLTSSTIEIEKRMADFAEVKGLIQQSKFVLFPYIGNSVSSSGALIDTITMGGNSVGPCVGAFEDLQKEGVCFTYQNYEELIQIISSDKHIKSDKIKTFNDNNTWEQFASVVKNELVK